MAKMVGRRKGSIEGIAGQFLNKRGLDNVLF